jgi:hypothetical protein
MTLSFLMPTPHIGVFLFGQNLSFSAEAVEKVRMMIFDNFSIVKKQLLTSHRRLQNGQFWGFSAASL